MTPVQDRILATIQVSAAGCWDWQGYKTERGYGRLSVHGKPTPAHRASYEAFVGPIPDGLVTDHLCRNTSCVNPDHLEAVTQRENIRRGEAPSAQSVRSNRCRNGHLFSPANTYVTRSGTRVCRSCQRKYSRAYYAARRAAR